MDLVLASDIEAVDECIEVWPEGEKGEPLTPEDIKAITDLFFVQHRGERSKMDICRLWNEKNTTKTVSYASVQKYIAHYQKTKEYYTPNARGPKRLMLKEEEEKLLELTPAALVSHLQSFSTSCTWCCEENAWFFCC